ncbi:membrane protein [Streptomyces phage Sollertia]|nr:membrane protein [Streptomyces phage Sollertia]
MSKISAGLVKAYAHPLVIIEVIIAVGLLVSGLYTMSWLYESSSNTPIGQAIDSTYVRMTIGAFYSFSGLAIMAGAKKGGSRWESTGLFMASLSYGFMTLLRWLTIGFTPLTWVFSLTLMFIVAFLYFRIRLLR